jgi:hypothetical protein
MNYSPEKQRATYIAWAIQELMPGVDSEEEQDAFACMSHIATEEYDRMIRFFERVTPHAWAWRVKGRSPQWNFTSTDPFEGVADPDTLEFFPLYAIEGTPEPSEGG